MQFLLWAVSVLLTSLLFSWMCGKAVRDSYEKRIYDTDQEYSKESKERQDDFNDLIFRRDKEITSLTLENINLTHENDILTKKLKDLEQKYEIKTSMCLGLQKNARLWHESYEELESHIDEVRERCSSLLDNKEKEHQKEIEDLTRYYKEKISHYTQPCELGGNCQNVD